MTTTSQSKRAQVGHALKDRLESITKANGYAHTIKKVYYDKIPMGLELQDHELPALFMIDEGADIQHLHQEIDVGANYRLQLIHSQVPDDTMNEIQRAIGKAIFANSASIARNGEFRFHPSVYQVTLVGDETDLQLIEANRICTLRLVARYRTKAYDM